jgi:hypothetical protein
LSSQPIVLADQVKPFPQSDFLACGHPVKGAALRSASLRDGFAALDGDPATSGKRSAYETV